MQKRTEDGDTQIVEFKRRTRELGKLPPADTTRWVPRRKAEVVSAVERGILTMEEACARYSLTEEEYQSWVALVRSHGTKGLRVTRLQEYQRRSLRRLY